MRWIDLILTYFVVGAPIGVHSYVNRSHGRRAGGLAVGVYGALLWPYQLVMRGRPAASHIWRSGFDKSSFEKFDAEKSLHAFNKLVCWHSERLSEADKQRQRDIRLAFEKYLKLAETVHDLETCGNPTERELRLFEIDNRSMEDRVAGARCIRRRNLERARAHLKTARHEIVAIIYSAGGLRQDRPAASNGTWTPFPEDRFSALVSIIREVAEAFGDAGSLHELVGSNKGRFTAMDEAIAAGFSSRESINV
jgi:hypothetical protein